MWIARDKNGKLRVYKEKPIRVAILSDKLSDNEKEFWDEEEVFDGYDKWIYPGDYFELDPSLFPDLTWEDEPQEVSLVRVIPEEKRYITLTTYFENPEKSHAWFLEMLSKIPGTDRYDTPEKREEAWENHIKVEYCIDEISGLLQCDGYTKVVFPMGRHDNQPDYDRVIETKEYIEEYFNQKF